MKFKEHAPNYCDYECKEHEFNTLEELLKIPFVKQFSMNPFDREKPHKFFKQYSLSDYVQGLEEFHDHELTLLMAEYNQEGAWKNQPGCWVVGYITKKIDEKIDLPIFIRPENRKDDQ